MSWRLVWSIYGFLILNFCNGQTTYNVNIDTSKPLRSVAREFMSVTFDASNAASPIWNGINFTVIEPLASALRPVYFRFGGTSCNFITFIADAPTQTGRISMDWSGNFTLNGTQLDQLYNFAKNAGWRLIYDFNELWNRPTAGAPLNLTNAKSLLDYTSSKGYILDFELGNEQDIIEPRLSGAVLASDYAALRALLDTYPLYKNSMIMGPSTAGGSTQVLPEFLNAGGGKSIQHFSFHHYYFGGAGSKLEDYMDPKRMDSLIHEVQDVVKLGFPSNWLGETSSAYNGGGVNLSDTYVAGYLWLDKLGISAKYGLDVVMRQQIYGSYQIGDMSSYSLVNKDLRPNPDYWLSLLHKRLVGLEVYNLTFSPANEKLRMYAHSSAKLDGYAIYGFNLGNQPLTLDIPQFTNKQVTAYIVTPSEAGNLQSWFNQVNGQTIKWSPHTPAANIQGNPTTLPVTIPEYAQFFLVVDQTPSQTCPPGWKQEKSIAGKCYRVEHEPQPWFGAQVDCSVYGRNASLLSIQSAFENAEILVADHGCKSLYLGLYRSGNSWAWSDGNPTGYFNWKSGFPTNDPTKNCVSFDTGSGTWENTDCDASTCFICEKYL